MYMIGTIFLAIIISFLLLYRSFKKSYKFWEELGVPYWKPDLLFGNFKDVALYRIPIVKFHLQMYTELSPHKFGGIFMFQKPALVVRDPELIKHVLIKDFNHFIDRGVESDGKLEPLSKHLFSLEGDDWKNLRAKLTCTFTSGRMKLMFPLLEECAEKLSKSMENFSKNQDFDIKELSACYGTDVIGSCAFGLTTGTLENPNSEFRQMGRRFFRNRKRILLRILFPRMPSFLIDLLGLHFVEKDLEKYFISIVRDAVNYREKNGVQRNDFLDLLIGLKNDKDCEEINKIDSEDVIEARKVKIDMTPELMAAQCFIFFVAGFETTSSVLSFMFLEISQNFSIQEKLYNEITTVLAKFDNKLTYDALKDLKYMDMAIAESMRKYPSVGALQRSCTTSYKIPDTNITIPKKTTVLISIFGLHLDERYFPNPDTFNPENFTEEAKSKRPQYCYMPFGEGPRACIAERFGKMQLKTAAVYLIKNYKFNLAPRMKIPIELDYTFGITACKGGIWLQCTPRN